MSAGPNSKDRGIPTRAIHEAYLQLQGAHRTYRQVRDDPNTGDADERRALGELQGAVLTFYELVRPHLKHETSLADYWDGDLPDYTGWGFQNPGEAATYVQAHGTGVYQVQQHTTAVEADQEMLTDGGVETFEDWHDFLGLSWDSERLVSVQPDDGDRCYVRLLRAAVLPLRELDHWRAHLQKDRRQGDGFMAGETTVETRREFEPAMKLVVAKRLLVEAADKLGALSEFDASTQESEITKQDIEKVEEWHQNQTE